jgi:hypothetical protein
MAASSLWPLEQGSGFPLGCCDHNSLCATVSKAAQWKRNPQKFKKLQFHFETKPKKNGGDTTLIFFFSLLVMAACTHTLNTLLHFIP